VTLAQAIERIQFCYPQVYYACHTRHDRARSTPAHLSARDSEILVHLDRRTPLTLSTLAAHMDLSRSTLSEALSKLESFGYVAKHRDSDRDRRRVGLVLTPKGVEAVRANSVLEAGRLRAALASLSAADRAAAVGGLELLARACRPRFNTVRHGSTRFNTDR
jgi:DNA-binding MarR family transcriptional regulator